MSFIKYGLATLACASTLCAASLHAATIEVLPMGDSITFGVGTDRRGDASRITSGTTAWTDNLTYDDAGGYRFFVDRRFGANVEFVGNRSDGDGFTGGGGFVDNQHFGVPSASASKDNPFGGSNTPSMLTGIEKADSDPASQDAAFNPADTKPDAILLHIGINDIGDSLPPSEFTNESQGDRADRLPGIAADRFELLLDGDTNTNRTGLVARLTDPNFFDRNAKLFVSFITPNTRSTSAAMRQRLPRLVAEFNSLIKELINERSNGSVSSALAGRVTFVDQFSIRIDDLNLGALANEFFSGEEDPQDALLDAISPDDDGAIDYVDWVAHQGFDEGEYEDGVFNTQQDVSSNNTNTNTWLMEDGLHPSNLGAAIMAQVWSDALLQQYPAIPEPGAAALVLGGGGLLLLRRRRRTSPDG